MNDTFDLDAYLERIGLRAQPRPGLAEIHRAHVTSIPFENLDPHRGLPISLDPDDLQRKLVSARRGGYCFEQNLLLKLALEALGDKVDLLLARVRLGAPRGAVRPRTHLVLRVRHGDATWHADVGFGAGTLLEPIPFGPGAVHDQSGWRFRVISEHDQLVLQLADDEGWRDLYGFVPQPVPEVDVETSNWFTSTHPRSPFVTGLIVSIQKDSTRTTLSDWDDLTLAEQRPGASTIKPVRREEIPLLLAERFDLPGYTVDGAGRVARVEGN